MTAAYDIWAALPDKQYIFLVTIGMFNGTTERTLYLSNTGVVLGSRYYYPLVKSLPALSFEMQETNYGRAQSTYGELKLFYEPNTPIAPDGLTFDNVLTSWSMAGRRVTISMGGPGLAIADYAEVFTGRVRSVGAGGGEVIIDVTDRFSQVDDVVSNGDVIIDATYDDAEGFSAPLALGRCLRVPCVYLGELDDVPGGPWATYMCHSPETDLYSASIPNVYVDGKRKVPSYTYGTAGIFLFPDEQEGDVTADVYGTSLTEGGTVQTRPNGLIKLLMDLRMGAETPVDNTAFTAFGTDMPYNIGVYVDDNRNLTETTEEIMMGLPAFYGFSRSGSFGLWEFKAPSVSETNALTINSTNRIENSEFISEDLRIYRQIVVTYAKLFYSPGQASRRVKTVNDAALVARYSNSTVHTFETRLHLKTSADAVAAKWKTLFGQLRHIVDCEICMGKILNLGDQVMYYSGQAVLSGGARLRVVGIEEDYDRKIVKLRLWG